MLHIYENGYKCTEQMPGIAEAFNQRFHEISVGKRAGPLCCPASGFISVRFARMLPTVFPASGRVSENSVSVF